MSDVYTKLRFLRKCQRIIDPLRVWKLNTCANSLSSSTEDLITMCCHMCYLSALFRNENVNRVTFSPRSFTCILFQNESFGRFQHSKNGLLWYYSGKNSVPGADQFFGFVYRQWEIVSVSRRWCKLCPLPINYSSHISARH